MKKLQAGGVGRKNPFLVLAVNLKESGRRNAFYVVLNTVLAEKRFFTYRMFPRVFA